MRTTAVAITVLAVVTGCQRATGPPKAFPRSPNTASSHPDAVGTYRSVRGYSDIALPLRVRIPKIGVNSALERLGRLADGTVDVPHAWNLAGWYAAGPRPGEPGAAVILGHVDSRTGPAVFLRVRELRPGDAVFVDRGDGSHARFAVTGVREFPKDHFPTAEVYFPTLVPGLRLLTCGGTFDRTAGHYRSNLVAFATLVR